MGGVRARPLLIDPLTRSDELGTKVEVLAADGDVVVGYAVRVIGMLRFEEVYEVPVGTGLGELR